MLGGAGGGLLGGNKIGKQSVIGCLSSDSLSSKAFCITLPASTIHFSSCFGRFSSVASIPLSNNLLMSSGVRFSYASAYRECTLSCMRFIRSDCGSCVLVVNAWQSLFLDAHIVSNISSVSRASVVWKKIGVCFLACSFSASVL